MAMVFRYIPYMRLLTAIKLIKRSWDNLDAAERREAGRLIAQFRGRPSNLDQGERQKLVRIARKAVGF